MFKTETGLHRGNEGQLWEMFGRCENGTPSYFHHLRMSCSYLRRVPSPPQGRTCFYRSCGLMSVTSRVRFELPSPTVDRR